MNEEPDFSIVTPSYNYAQYIRECIESVKSQEGVTFEHIVQEAGSTDGTREILKEYSHLRVYEEKDSGMSDGINRGFRRARGRWGVGFNTDDRLLPGALAAVKRFVEEHPEADVVYGAWNFIDKDGNHIRSMKALPFCENMLIWYGCYLPSTSLFFRRSTIMDEGFLVDERFKFIMDGEYYVRLSRAGKKFLNFNHLLADFRLHGGNISAEHREKADMETELYRQKLQGEDAAIRRVYGYAFKRFSYNYVLDGLLKEAYRVKKLFLNVVTPWK